MEIVEFSVAASYLNRGQKFPYVQKAVLKLDILKFILQVSWEIKALDNKKFIVLSEKLDEIGKMLGGWRKSLDIPGKKNRTY